MKEGSTLIWGKEYFVLHGRERDGERERLLFIFAYIIPSFELVLLAYDGYWTVSLESLHKHQDLHTFQSRFLLYLWWRSGRGITSMNCCESKYSWGWQPYHSEVYMLKGERRRRGEEDGGCNVLKETFLPQRCCSCWTLFEIRGWKCFKVAST